MGHRGQDVHLGLARESLKIVALLLHAPVEFLHGEPHVNGTLRRALPEFLHGEPHVNGTLERAPVEF